MPFFNEHLTAYMNRQVFPEFKSAIEELEATLDAPVRVLDLEQEGRDRANHATWRGASRTLAHYQTGTTEEDFNAKGVSIFVRAWNNNTEDTNGQSPHWHTTTFNMAELLTEGIGRYAPNRENQLPTEERREHYGYDAGQVQGFDGAHSIDRGDTHLVDIWDEGRCIYISPAMYNLIEFGKPDWQDLLVQPLLQMQDPELLEKAREAQAAIARAAFAAMLEDRGDEALKEAREKAVAYAVEAGEMEEKLVNAKANREQYSRQLAFLMEQGEELNEAMIEKEWKGITDNVNVTRFLAGKGMREDRWGTMRESPWLKVYTKDLFITNPENGREMVLGQYEVTMNFGDNTLRIKNITMPQFGGDAINQRNGANTRWDHPHVQDGGLCQAEYRTAISTLLRDRKLAVMTGMLFQILGTVTLDDNWGKCNIRLWEQADAQLRAAKGWPEWTADETEHPLKAAAREEAEANG